MFGPELTCYAMLHRCYDPVVYPMVCCYAPKCVVLRQVRCLTPSALTYAMRCVPVEPVSNLTVWSSHNVSHPSDDVQFHVSVQGGGDINVTLTDNNGQALRQVTGNSSYVPVITYAFPVGNHTLTFTANNSVSSSDVTIFLTTMTSLDSLAVSQSCNETTCVISVTSDADSYPTCRFDFGDNSSVSSSRRHVYRDCGIYPVVTECSNALGSASRELNVTALMTIDLTVSHSCQLANCVFNWTVRPDTVFTFCKVDFGDFYFAVVADSVYVDHMYNASGTYVASVRCYSTCSDDLRRLNVVALDEVSGLRVEYPTGVVSDRNEWRIVVHIDTGYPVDITAETEDGRFWIWRRNATYNVSNDLMYVSVPARPHWYGTKLVRVNVTNGQSVEDTEFNVAIVEALQGTSVGEKNNLTEVSVGRPLEFVVEASAGSNVSGWVEPGDSQSTEDMNIDTPQSGSGGVARVNITYTHPGSFSPTFYLQNAVSAANISLTVVVQERLVNLTLTAEQAVAAGTLTTFTVTTKSRPTDPGCGWTFGDGSFQEMAPATQLADGRPLTVDHSYTVAHLGGLRVNVTCGNLVSQEIAWVTVDVQETITDLNVTLSHAVIAVGNQINITVTIKTGSPVMYTVDYDDGNQHNPYDLSSLTTTKKLYTFEPSYPITGNYTFRVNASNDVSAESLSRHLVVQALLEGVSLYAPTRSDDMLVTFAVNSSTPSENVFFEWEFGDNSSETDYRARVAHDSPYTKTHMYRQTGPFTVNLTCSNLVSQLVLTAHVTVEVSLIARIRYNDYRLVSREDNITMNAVSVTEDLDGRPERLSFTWYCRREDEGEVITTDNPRVVSLPSGTT